ncbi:hypothetical protein AGMMS4957_18880 [Bacteroidia bacterium]|nr:hypothetical protein AGMMS4957_18880 [Bacteroidia bacterium]
MIFTKISLGTKILGTAIILTSLVLEISCTDYYSNYLISVKNTYFEPLYHVKIGDVTLTDTLLIDAGTEKITVEQGRYLFSAVTASGMSLQADLYIKGYKQNINLVVNEQGKLLKE